MPVRVVRRAAPAQVDKEAVSDTTKKSRSTAHVASLSPSKSLSRQPSKKSLAKSFSFASSRPTSISDSLSDLEAGHDALGQAEDENAAAGVNVDHVPDAGVFAMLRRALVEQEEGHDERQMSAASKGLRLRLSDANLLAHANIDTCEEADCVRHRMPPHEEMPLGTRGSAGIGLLLSPNFYVEDLKPGGAAAINGQIRVGDQITSVDDTWCSSQSFDAISRYIRGPGDSPIRLGVSRGNELIEVFLHRSILPSQTSSCDPDIGAIMVHEHQRACDWCGVRDKAMLQCGGCLLAWYCGKTCQKHAWKHGHESECNKGKGATDEAATPDTPVVASAKPGAQHLGRMRRIKARGRRKFGGSKAQLFVVPSTGAATRHVELEHDAGDASNVALNADDTNQCETVGADRLRDGVPALWDEISELKEQLEKEIVKLCALTKSIDNVDTPYAHQVLTHEPLRSLRDRSAPMESGDSVEEVTVQKPERQEREPSTLLKDEGRSSVMKENEGRLAGLAMARDEQLKSKLRLEEEQERLAEEQRKARRRATAEAEMARSERVRLEAIAEAHRAEHRALEFEKERFQLEQARNKFEDEKRSAQLDAQKQQLERERVAWEIEQENRHMQMQLDKLRSQAQAQVEMQQQAAEQAAQHEMQREVEERRRIFRKQEAAAAAAAAAEHQRQHMVQQLCPEVLPHTHYPTHLLSPIRTDEGNHLYQPWRLAEGGPTASTPMLGAAPVFLNSRFYLSTSPGPAARSGELYEQEAGTESPQEEGSGEASRGERLLPPGWLACHVCRKPRRREWTSCPSPKCKMP